MSSRYRGLAVERLPSLAGRASLEITRCGAHVWKRDHLRLHHLSHRFSKGLLQRWHAIPIPVTIMSSSLGLDRRISFVLWPTFTSGKLGSRAVGGFAWHKDTKGPFLNSLLDPFMELESETESFVFLLTPTVSAATDFVPLEILMSRLSVFPLLQQKQG